jgi:hypothetical protein
MKNIKDELQRIILGHEPVGQANQLKKIQRFLRSNAETSLATKKQQRFKSEETAALLTFAGQEPGQILILDSCLLILTKGTVPGQNNSKI